MATPTLVELAESGAHFGHHRSLTFPKARDFVYMIKSNVALIDLEKTQAAIEQAQKIINQYRAEGRSILMVGTKRSVRGVLKEVAESIGASYITERWFGGMLTNFDTMRDSIKRMNELEEFLASDKAAKLSKKDRLTRERRLHRSQRFLQGVSSLKAMPELIILASASDDAIAIEEANQLEIPVMAITDTDMNPARVAYPIPANDDAPRAVELILRSIVSKTEGSAKPDKILRSIVSTPAAKKEKAAPEQPEAIAEATPEKPAKTAAKKPVTKKVVAKKAVAKAKK